LTQNLNKLVGRERDYERKKATTADVLQRRARKTHYAEDIGCIIADAVSEDDFRCMLEAGLAHYGRTGRQG
jgi:hypothetical protein